MGNTPSQEAPRRPHKLTKPQLDLQVAVAGLTDPTTLDSPSCHGRSSTSYLVGSVPISPTSSSPTDLMGFSLGNSIIPGAEIDNSLTSTARRQSYPDPRRCSNVSRTWSFRSEYSPRRHSMTAANSRPHSLIIDGGLPIARSDSLHAATGYDLVHYDVRNYEIQRLVSLDPKILKESAMAALEGHSPVGNVTETTWKSSHPSQSPSISIEIANSDRTDSDLSLYPPVRRRSIIQTPGVATRAQRSDTSSSKTSSFQSTVSTTPEETRNNSIESDKQDHLSIPAISHGPNRPERVVTPCEADYKQLGGIKFGSLRIVNGSPQLSPMPENDVEANKFRPSSQACFDCETLCSPTPTSTSSNSDCVDPVAHQLHKTSISLATALKSREENCHSKLSPLSEAGSWQVSPTTEILPAIDDSNRKPALDGSLELESETLKALDKSDSGVVFSSPFEGSRRVASKTDSGYSSNVSLGSLRSLKSAVTDLSRKSPEKQKTKLSDSLSYEHPSSPASVKATAPARPGPAPQQHEASGSDDAARAKSSAYRSLTSLTRGKILRMPSLRSSKSVEFHLSKPGSQSSPVRSDPLQNQQTTGNNLPRPRPPRLTLDTSNVSNDARPHRSIHGSQRRGPPKVRDNRTKDRNLSLRTNRVSNSSPGGNPRAGNMQNRPWLRDEKSEDTLRTILSVGSTDVLGRQSSSNVREEPADILDAKLSVPQAQRRKSLRRSLTQVATALFSLDKTPTIKESGESEDKNLSNIKVSDSNAQQNNAASAVKSPRVRSKINLVESAPQSPAKRAMSRTPSSNTLGRNTSNTDLSNIAHGTATSMRSRSVRVPQSQKLDGRRFVSSSSVAPLRRQSVPPDVYPEQTHGYHPTQTQAAVYGMPLSLNGVMPMAPQQMGGFQGYQMVPMQMVSSPYYPTRPPITPGHRRTRSMPISGQLTRSQSMHSSSQHSRYPPQVQHMGSSYQVPQQFVVQSIDPMLYQHFNPQAVPNLVQNQPQHRRALSQGTMYNVQAPPYRVLHSYHPQAYRGVPTWG
ncbi:hypothetical protein BGZ63DRAFT_156059 [Mariannaea sp. PMI_226]|nr:hypothetical protein BGZ63DRAFT_156059 [Mariannaea sp. PMI_226]